MLDFGHLPKPQNGTIDYFPGFSTSAGSSWQVWNKPKGCMFIRILCIAGGGGGGSGFSSATTNSRAGGSGGTSSSIFYVTIPAVFLPDRLYVSSGVGGRGGASSTPGSSNNGSAGVPSYVSIAPSTLEIYLICACSADTSLITGINCNQSFQGYLNGIAGVVGLGGGSASGGNGNGVTYPTSGILLSGGAGGGGGAGFSGGSVVQPAGQTSDYTLFQTLLGGTGGNVSTPIGGNGSAGVELYQPLLATGGSGGGSSFDATSRGGDGGDGGFGCGGGGGGAGGTDGSGAGGNGGPGLVVIHTW